jgi:hypothetical protein
MDNEGGIAEDLAQAGRKILTAKATCISNVIFIEHFVSPSYTVLYWKLLCASNDKLRNSTNKNLVSYSIPEAFLLIQKFV